MKIYFDNCCYSRLFDDDTGQPRMTAETDRIRDIIRRGIRGEYDIIGSFAVETEIGQIDNTEKRQDTERYYSASIAGKIDLSSQIIERAEKLNLMGLGMMDSRHLATAEAAGVEFLITTDDKFIKKCKNRSLTTIKVINPLDF